MANYIQKYGINIDSKLFDFVNTAALPGTSVESNAFWAGFSEVIAQMMPRNRALLERRKDLQTKIDAWHIKNKSKDIDYKEYISFLYEIGYLIEEGPDFTIKTQNTDEEIAVIAGPQLVVPVMNARYALNAANARWGSLYDALYGTDAIPVVEGEDRAAQVIAAGRAFLDEYFPISDGKNWGKIRNIAVSNGILTLDGSALITPSLFAGHHKGEKIYLINNGLHVEIHLDAQHHVGKDDLAHIADIRVEAALSAIMDCEDSIAAVDAEDKIVSYRNWLGLMTGDLQEEITKNNKTIKRKLNPDLPYTAPDGSAKKLRARALLWVRNVGHLMTTPAVLDAQGAEIGEGILDAFITVLCALHDMRKTEEPRNSPCGSVYVVKPKMHGPEEVAFSDDLFTEVERVLCLPRYTVKLGLMDEERRTSANLKECIRAAEHRVAFINTGFLDRTGDELHTSMEAGPMLPKGEMKNAAWITAYEMRNVDIGLACGLRGKAQIGKGMWAMPDRMAEMLSVKVAHPESGASCAWVPSPTAAVLHALHYHKVNVAARQEAIAKAGLRASLTDLLTLPLAKSNWSQTQVKQELENNCQSILGYVVRWVDLGIGCSKVPDIHDVALMEDRATCRISAQALTNWLHHGVISAQDVTAAMRKMALVVDRQNADDPDYTPMAPDYTGDAFMAACELVLQGRVQPSGYTEPVLHARRLLKKSKGN